MVERPEDYVVNRLPSYDPFVHDDERKYRICTNLRLLPIPSWTPANWLVEKSMIVGPGRQKYIPAHTKQGIGVRLFLWVLIEYFHKNPTHKELAFPDLVFLQQQMEYKYKTFILMVIKERMIHKRLVKMAKKSVQVIDYMRSQELVEQEVKESHKALIQKRIDVLSKTYSYPNLIKSYIDILAGSFIEVEYVPHMIRSVYKTEELTQKKRAPTSSTHVIRPLEPLWHLIYMVVRHKYLF